MKKLILILPILAGFLFGSTGVFTRTLTAHGFNNVTILAARTLFAAVLMGVLILLGDRNLFKIRLKDLPLFLGTGLLSMMCVNLCYNVAVSRLALSLAAVLLATAPLFVLLFSAILFKEKITARKIGCLALALFGCILACGLSGQTGNTGLSFHGILPGVAAAVFCALYSIFSKLAAQNGYHTYTIIFYSLLVIAVACAPFADYETIGTYLSEITGYRLLFLIMHALCLSILPYLCITAALLHAEAGIVSILASGTEPIAAAVFGVIFFGEIPTITLLIGMAAVVASVTLLCINPKMKKATDS